MNGATVERRAARRAEQLSAADRWILSRLHAVVAEVDALLRGLPVRQVSRRALPLRLGRGLRLVRRAGQGQFAAGGERGRGHRRGPRPRPRRHAAAAAPGRPVRHRDAVDRADRRRVAGRRRLAGRRPAAGDAGGRGRDRRRCSSSSPRSAGSAPTRASSPASGSRPGSTGLDDAGSPRTRPRSRSLARLDGARRRLHRRRASLGRAGGRHRDVELDLSGTIDVAAERKRLAKDLRRGARRSWPAPTAKLGNDAFVAKAPGRGGREDQGAARASAAADDRPDHRHALERAADA